MPAIAGKITPFLWFDKEAEDAAKFYTAIFPDSRIKSVSRYGKAGRDTHGMDAGTVMTVAFEIAGQNFVALNGGPLFRFTEAVSFQIACQDQDEIDFFWSRLTDGGEEGRCGWLKDRFGLSWQVIPSALPRLLAGSDPASAGRAMTAMLQMKKFDIAALERAGAGQA